MLSAPTKKFTVQFDKAFEDEVVTESGIKLYRDTSYHPEVYTQTNGKVVGVPRFSNINVSEGDQLYFSYQVVIDWQQRDNDSPIHRNMVYYEQEQYWMVDEKLCYFKVKDDKLTMLNSYILLNPVEEEIKSTLIIPEHLKKKRILGSAIVIESGDESICKEGDLVFFDKNFVEYYEFFGMEYNVLKHTRVLAKL